MAGYDDRDTTGSAGSRRARTAVAVAAALVVGFGAGFLARDVTADDGGDAVGLISTSADAVEPGTDPVIEPTTTTLDADGTARAEVEAAFRRAFGGEDETGLLEVVDDPTGLAELRTRLREQYPEMLGGRVTYEITDIVLVGSSEATFRFRPVIADYAEMPVQTGGATLIGAEWKITRATACAMFRLGGAAC
jgi:hypothetical protein